MDRLAAGLDRTLETIILGVFGCLCLLVFGQVVARYLFNHPYFWADELTIYTFTWTVFLGAALALRSQRHVSISYFVSLLPARVRMLSLILSDLIVLAFLVLLLVQGVRFSRMNHSVNSIALEVPLSYVAASLVVMTLAMILFTLESLRHKIRRTRVTPDEPHGGEVPGEEGTP